MSFRSSNINNNWIVGFVAFSPCAFHFFLVMYSIVYSLINPTPSELREGSLEGLLVVIHIGLFLLLIAYALAIVSKASVSRIISIASGSVIMWVYYWWYYEKFRLVESEASPDYYSQLSEFGFFRGSISVDYWAFALTVLLILYSISRSIYVLIQSRPKKLI